MDTRVGLFDWLLAGKQGRGSAPDNATPLAKPRSYSAAEVVAPHEGSCHEARSVAGKRFLASEAPRLPMRDCDRPECHCTYRRHPDRRQDVRRASDAGAIVLGSGLRQESDNRDASLPGRRRADRR